MRRYCLLTILFLFALFSDPLWAEKKPLSAINVRAQDFEGVIFPAERDYQPQFKQMFPEFVGRFTPTREEAKEADALTQAYLKNYTGENSYYTDNVPKIIDNMDSYARQFFGFVDKEGNKVIWINYIMIDGPDSFVHWRNDIVFVDDGGYRYFNIKVNLTTDRCYGLRINGVA